MEQTRQHSWEHDLSELKKTHDFSYKVAQLQSKLIKEVVEKLAQSGIDLQPLFDQHKKETEKLVHQFQNQK